MRKQSMKRQRNVMSRSRREDKDAELQRVLEDLEAEHGTTQYRYVLARFHAVSEHQKKHH